MSLLLALAHITKRYHENAVLVQCTYSFEREGMYVLTGPNGSGKSTLLRIAALLEEADSGSATYIDGTRTLPVDLALQRRISLVLPKAAIFNATVYQNAGYGLKVRGIPRQERRERVYEYLEAFGLQKKLDQHARSLSSGETQRLTIARALVTDPEILFLDEPTASVDEHNREVIEERICDAARQPGRTVIMTTHDPQQAERLADVRLAMHGGRIIQL